MKYLLLLFCSTFYGQILHHQMISSQGSSSSLPDGIIIKQTIGQQSVTGNSSGEYIILQGFQQNHWSKIISQQPITSGITVAAYPNPFVSEVHFKFSIESVKEISVAIFDIGGRLIFNQVKNVGNSVVTLDLSSLPNGMYLVRLNNKELNYFIKIIKTL